jgi:uncharacterized protein YqhQ
MKPINIGGQAVMEGVVIQSPAHVTMAVRRKDNSITLVTEEASGLSKRHAWARWPIVRGVVNLGVQLKVGYRMLMKSADYIAIDETGKAEQNLGAMGAVATIIAIVFALGLFVVLPNVMSRTFLSPTGVWRSLFEGLLRIAILAAYMGSVGLLSDMKRVYMYHGAEHRVLHCYENGEEPNAQNCKKYSVVHPRCGTSFLFLVALVSIVVFAILGRGASMFWGIVIRLASMPLVAGLAYELLRVAARHENIITRILRAPGLLLQRLTTRIPTDDMIEVAAAAYREAIKDV